MGKLYSNPIYIILYFTFSLKSNLKSFTHKAPINHFIHYSLIFIQSYVLFGLLCYVCGNQQNLDNFTVF